MQVSTALPSTSLRRDESKQAEIDTIPGTTETLEARKNHFQMLEDLPSIASRSRTM
jgi:hypothetical protein